MLPPLFDFKRHPPAKCAAAISEGFCPNTHRLQRDDDAVAAVLNAVDDVVRVEATGACLRCDYVFALGLDDEGSMFVAVGDGPYLDLGDDGLEVQRVVVAKMRPA